VARTPDALKKPTGEKSVSHLHDQADRVLRLRSASLARGTPGRTPDLLVSVSLSEFCASKGTERLMVGTRVSLILGFFISYNRFVFFLLLPLMFCTVHSETLRGSLFVEQLRGRHSARWWTKCLVIQEEDVKVDGT
jgi:hypothetical protein